MEVAYGKFVLDFFQNDSMKLKHKNIENLCAELKRKYNISVLEIEDFDDPEKCVLGFSAVIPSNWERSGADNFIEKIFKTIDEVSPSRLVFDDCKFVAYD